MKNLFLLILTFFIVTTTYTEDIIHLDVKIKDEEPKKEWVFEKLEFYCDSLNIPYDLMYQIGMNESGLLHPNDSNFIQGPDYVKNEDSQGDFQMIHSTWRVWSKKLKLEEKNRENLLIACTHYFKYCYIYGDSSWRKARYIYARGRWKEPYRWTRLERKFMDKINFNTYDSTRKKRI
jgi:hypothetical protein